MCAKIAFVNPVQIVIVSASPSGLTTVHDHDSTRNPKSNADKIFRSIDREKAGLQIRKDYSLYKLI